MISRWPLWIGSWQQAVGPMQFLPATFTNWAIDADAGGSANPRPGRHRDDCRELPVQDPPGRSPMTSRSTPVAAGDPSSHVNPTRTAATSCSISRLGIGLSGGS